MNFEMKGITLKILLVYLRSEQFYSILNPLSIEALIGHIEGSFEGQVVIDYEDIISERDIDALYESVKANAYDIIGFSIMPYTSELYIKILQKISFSSDALIVLGNQLATYVPFYLLNESIKHINGNRVLAVKGEGEEILEEIIRYLMIKENHSSLDDDILETIPNLVYIDSTGEYKATSEKIMSLKKLIYPPKYIIYNKPFIQMQLSRGCYWGNCIYCTRKSFRMGANWESFPIERIKEDLFKVIVSMKINIIEFCDDEFFGGRNEDSISRAYIIAEYINELCAKYHKSIRFRLFTRPDFIFSANNLEWNEKVKQLLIRLKEIGLTRIYIGIESGSDTQLSRYNRGVTKEIIRNALLTLEEIGIKYDGGYILFDKSLSLQEMLESIEFYESTNLIESNQWIWRPLVADLGSTIGRELIQCSNCPINNDTMEVSYIYDNKVIQKIHELIDVKSLETRELFYALKVISKEDYEYEDKKSSHSLAHKLVKRNGAIYVNFLKSLVKLILEKNPSKIYENEKGKMIPYNETYPVKDIINELVKYIDEGNDPDAELLQCVYEESISFLLRNLDNEVLELIESCKEYCNKGIFNPQDSQALNGFIENVNMVYAKTRNTVKVEQTK